ncbi:MAG: alpha/beta fold hydrolase [Ardenticatenaceae bacterium]|nr:alpha/beta fold hydrolase [Ardenticatenaceae bacterium]MCB9444378.1 alpha/beta fold hydrolase [Ardenticatenaceae bacterium]
MMGFVVALIVVVVVVFLAGPRVKIDTTLRPFTLPPDLDQYLAESEGCFDDIVPNTEKTIFWAGEPGQKTAVSIIYLHGFSATRQETAPLADKVAAALGANLFYTRFTGHGRTGQAMAEATVNDWLNDTMEAVAIGRRIGEKVIVIGVSTGAAAATWLAAQPHLEDMLAFILISPNYFPHDRSAAILTWPWGEQIATALIGPERNWEPSNEAHGRYWTLHYPTKALLPMMGLVKLVSQTDLSRITRPVLIIYSPQDEVVNPQRAEAAFAQMSRADKRIIPIVRAPGESNHVLVGDIMSPDKTDEMVQMILDFIRVHL